MTESDLATIEAELDITLPAEYRQLMRANPLAKYTGGQTPEPMPFTALIDKAQDVISLNRYFRKDGCWGAPWLPTYFCFASAMGMPYHFLDLALEHSPVYVADEESYAEIDNTNLAEWVEDELLRMEDWQEEIRETAERKRTKNWWQFWI